MSGIAQMLIEIDRICGQFATALQDSQLHIYTTLAFLLLLGVFLFPPRDDPDQI